MELQSFTTEGWFVIRSDYKYNTYLCQTLHSVYKLGC